MDKEKKQMKLFKRWHGFLVGFILCVGIVISLYKGYLQKGYIEIFDIISVIIAIVIFAIIIYIIIWWVNKK